MDIITSIFRRKSVVFEKLTEYGFIKDGNAYVYKTLLPNSGFMMTVRIDEYRKITAVVIDPECNEPYTLHLTDSAVGSFIGMVKSEYTQVFTDIANHCFEPEVFKTTQAKELIDYVRKTYDDELEYLWDKFPDNAVWRRKDNKKWYGALLTVSKRKLGIASDEIVEIIDLRAKPEHLENLIDHVQFYPGWHMNKKNWYTIILDGSVPLDEILSKLTISYEIAGKK